MPKSNKDKTKDPILEEIEKEIPEIVKPTNLDDLLNKNPDELTAEDMDVLSDHKEDLTPDQLVKVGLADKEEGEETDEVTTEPESTLIPETEVVPIVKTEPQPISRPIHKTEVIEPVEVAEPTENELRAYVAQDGVDIDELTAFEKATAKRNYIIEKRQESINNSFKIQKQSREWSNKIDSFLDSTNNDPKYTELSGHEDEFKQFALNHSETDIESLLLPAFLHNLPPIAPKRGGIFIKGGGGQAPEKPVDGIVDADLAAKLRVSDPREYKRQVQAGKIKLEI